MNTLLFAALAILALAAPQDANRDAAEFRIDKLETATGDLAEMKARRVIRVLTTYNKTNFFIAGGRLHGFEYELLAEFEKFLNKDITRGDLKTRLVYTPVPKDQLIPLLIQGKGDIIAAGLTVTPERLAHVSFTDPYVRDVEEIVVTSKGVQGLDDIDDLAGRTVHVVKASSYAEHLRAISERLQRFGRDKINIVEMESHLETEDLFEMVNAGILNIVVSDRHLAELWKGVFDNIVVRGDLRVNMGGRLAWGVRKTNPELKAALDAFVRESRRGTLLGNVVFRRYFEGTKWISNPLSQDKQRRLGELRGLFQEYGAQYDIDWLAIAALAYQESQLDQRRKSHAGAVGVMQIKPTTARQMGISDVTNARDNIHAGVKYLAWLRDHYFDDPSISKPNRLYFVAAAYNAGPSRVAGMRRAAAEMGYDPDVWFNNVERVAMKQVGGETVKYVANINKYYITLGFTRDNLNARSKALKSEGAR